VFLAADAKQIRALYQDAVQSHGAVNLSRLFCFASEPMPRTGVIVRGKCLSEAAAVHT
jgi:hypothetical protein